MASHDEIVKKFAARQLNTRTGKCEWTGSNVFCEEDVLYSYGRHFPLARYLGELDGLPFFLRNNDKYSSSTSHHQSITGEHCRGPSVSRHGLARFGIDFMKVELKQIVCWRIPFHHHVYWDTKTDKYYEDAHLQRSDGWDVKVDATNPWFSGGLEEKLVEGEWKPPAVGEFKPYYKRDKVNRIRGGVWVVKGAVVISHKRSQYLCSKDEKDQVFVRRLRGKATDIEDAFRRTVREQEASVR